MAMKKTNLPKKKTKVKEKEKITRTRILKAAIRVFSRHAYRAASIRMIGKEAEIDHPLISYYFPTKAELFEEVIRVIDEELRTASEKFYDGLSDMSIARGFSIFLDRLLEFQRTHKEYFRIVALNMVTPQSEDPIPGYATLQRSTLRQMEHFIKDYHITSPKYEVEMFFNSVQAIVISYLGASSFWAKRLKMNPESIEYFNWAKESILSTIEPRLHHLIKPEVKEISTA